MFVVALLGFVAIGGLMITFERNSTNANHEEYRTAAVHYFADVKKAESDSTALENRALQEYSNEVDARNHQRKIDRIQQIGAESKGSYEMQRLESEIKRRERMVEDLKLKNELIDKQKAILLESVLLRSRLRRELGEVQKRLNIDDSAALRIREEIKASIEDEIERKRRHKESFE